MLAVRVMEVIADEVVDVIAVRHSLMATRVAVLVISGVAAAAVLVRAAIRMPGVDLEDVLVDVALMRMVQVTVVQVIDVIAVRDAGMAAARAVVVGVIGMNRVLARHVPESGRPMRALQLVESKTRSHLPTVRAR
jgi:hypothetical protein